MSDSINNQPSTINEPEGLLTRAELAAALKISPRTVDRMIADQEITPIRLRGKLIRFHLPDVVAELRSRANVSKHACTRSL
jgi:excisionase family DNA binding protein